MWESSSLGRIFMADLKLVPTWEASCEGWIGQGMVGEMRP